MPSDNYEEIFNARPADGSGWVAHSNIFFLLFCYNIHLNIETNLVGFLRIISQATNAKTKIHTSLESGNSTKFPDPE